MHVNFNAPWFTLTYSSFENPWPATVATSTPVLGSYVAFVTAWDVYPTLLIGIGLSYAQSFFFFVPLGTALENTCTLVFVEGIVSNTWTLKVVSSASQTVNHLPLAGSDALG